MASPYEVRIFFATISMEAAYFHRRLLNLDFIVAIYQKIVSVSISQAVLCFFYEALAERFILRRFRVRVDSDGKGAPEKYEEFVS